MELSEFHRPAYPGGVCKMVFDQDTFCSFCNYPGAQHQGGAERDGIKVTGNFCSRDCFDKWLRWKNMLIAARMKPISFPQPEQIEGQAVLRV